MTEIPESLPEETKTAYQRYLELPLASRAILKNKINAYLETVANASGENEFLDLTTAKAIAKTLLTLIEKCPDDKICHLQAATYYFVEADDAAPDLDSILGFDDDAEVINAVCRFLGFLELEVEV